MHHMTEGPRDAAQRSTRPLVSTIIPVYNGATYISAAIKSALDQTYRNIEVIVVDDGSTDNTADIVAQFPVRYIKKANGGVASALNAGARAMKGDFFCWLSHDDLFQPSKIERQVETYLNLPTSERIILCSDYELINSRGEWFHTITIDTQLIAERPEYAVLRGLVNGCTVFIPVELFSEVGYFDESLPYTQDYDLWLRAMQRYRFVHMPEALIKCRQHDEQGSKKGDYAPEFNSLWTKALDSVSPERARELEGSQTQFFVKMQRFLSAAGAIEAAAEAAERALQSTRVSVVIPFFQNTDQLRAAVNSVLSQTHNNIEILVIYDTPETDISDALPSVLPAGFTVAHYCQHRRGAGLARNYGINRATGEYIAFLDSDDLFLPMKVERQLQVMLANDAFISHTSYFAFATDEILQSSYRPSGRFRGRVFPDILSNNPIAMPTAMVRAEVLRKYSFPDAYQCEDMLFWAAVTEEYELVGIDEGLSVVSVSSDSVAYNPIKQRNAVLRIVNAFEADPRFRGHTHHIEQLRKHSDHLLECVRANLLHTYSAPSPKAFAVEAPVPSVEHLQSGPPPIPGDNLRQLPSHEIDFQAELSHLDLRITGIERTLHDLAVSVEKIVQSRIWQTLVNVGGVVLRLRARRT
jgi:glycosyltransferase involved in cell wall biosynthesis